MGLSVFPAPASGPTLAEITTAGSSAGWGAVGGSWTYLQTYTANSAYTASFTGLSGYSKYRIIGVMRGGAGTRTMRINSDSSSLYGFKYNTSISNNSNNPYAIAIINPFYSGGDSINLENHESGTNFFYDITISNANATSPKLIDVNNSHANGGWKILEGTGLYAGTSAVSSVSITGDGSGTFDYGRLYLFGGN